MNPNSVWKIYYHHHGTWWWLLIGSWLWTILLFVWVICFIISIITISYKTKNQIAINNGIYTQKNKVTPCAVALHPDLQGNIYISNRSSSHRDYFEVVIGSQATKQYGISEPSTIYTDLPFFPPQQPEAVSKPPYYPSYFKLNPCQRYIYRQLLLNPYSDNIDVGYVFLLYYGLERQMFVGNYKESIEIVLKLQKIHQDHSFWFYSTKAVMLTCLRYNDTETLSEQIRMIQEYGIYNIDMDSYILAKLSLGLCFTAKDMIGFRNKLGYHSRTYIPSKAGQFEEALNAILKRTENADGISAKTLKEYRIVAKKESQTIYANNSLSECKEEIPVFHECYPFCSLCEQYLKSAHEYIKHSSKIPSTNAPESLSKEINYSEEEYRFISQLNYHLFSNDITEEPIINRLSDGTLVFSLIEIGQFGRVKLNGTKKRMQMLYSNNDSPVWLDNIELDDMISLIPNWILYISQQRIS